MRRAAAAASVVAALVIAEIVSSSGGSPVRRAAPALPASALRGAPVTLADLHGRPAVIDFWAAWCGPCRREAPALRQFAQAGRAALVGVDWTDNAGNARSFVRRYGWSFPVLVDRDGTVGDDYGLIGLPTSFVLDRSGRIATVLRGPQTAAQLERAVEAAG